LYKVRKVKWNVLVELIEIYYLKVKYFVSFKIVYDLTDYQIKQPILVSRKIAYVIVFKDDDFDIFQCKCMIIAADSTGWNIIVQLYNEYHYYIWIVDNRNKLWCI